MRVALVALFLNACAVSKYQYSESEQCPVMMDSEQKESGTVRCRALCSSYGRDMEGYTDDCKCYCATSKTYSNPMKQEQKQRGPITNQL
jgi:hypothetical protein